MIPTITIDGPSGSGKGTLGVMLAQSLGWHFLDSGSLYRVAAFVVLQRHMDIDNEKALATMAQTLPVHFESANGTSKVFLEKQDITNAIRIETCGMVASKIAKIPALRTALLARQHAFQIPPGLVADGRDMGTVVFPQAQAKFFLKASAQVRAERRLKQLKNQGIDGNLADVVRDLEERDKRDCLRAVAPLRPADDAIIIDTSKLSVSAVYAQMAEVLSKLGLML